MLTRHPHLVVRRPSPTTIEYKVSTAPESTLAKQILFVLIGTLRLALASITFLVLHSKWFDNNQSTPPTKQSSISLFSLRLVWQGLQYVQSTPVGDLSRHAADSLPVQALLPVALLIIYCCNLRLHTTESLLVLRGLGIQTSTSGATYLSGASTRFIPTENIQDMLVNEAFQGYEVRYYLAVVVQGEAEVVVVFPKLLPRRPIVERVWRGARDCLWEKSSTGRKGEDEPKTGIA